MYQQRGKVTSLESATNNSISIIIEEAMRSKSFILVLFPSQNAYDSLLLWDTVSFKVR